MNYLPTLSNLADSDINLSEKFWICLFGTLGLWFLFLLLFFRLWLFWLFGFLLLLFFLFFFWFLFLLFLDFLLFRNLLSFSCLLFFAWLIFGQLIRFNLASCVSLESLNQWIQKFKSFLEIVHGVNNLWIFYKWSWEIE